MNSRQSYNWLAGWVGYLVRLGTGRWLQNAITALWTGFFSLLQRDDPEESAMGLPTLTYKLSWVPVLCVWLQVVVEEKWLPGWAVRWQSGHRVTGPKGSFTRHTYSICLYWCLKFCIKMRVVNRSAFWAFPEMERQFWPIKQKAASFEILWEMNSKNSDTCAKKDQVSADNFEWDYQ